MANKKCQLTQVEYHLSKLEQNFFLLRNFDLPSICELERIRSILSLVPQPRFSFRNHYSLDCSLSLSSFAVNNVPQSYNKDLTLGSFKSFATYFSSFIAEQHLVEAIHDFENPLLYGSANLTNCLDCNFCLDCKDCYDSISCYQCEGVYFSRLSNFCYDSKFLDNCNNCRYCLFCSNLEDCEYFIFNKEVTKAEFLEINRSLSLLRSGSLDYEKERFESFLLNQPLLNLGSNAGFSRGYPLNKKRDYTSVFNSRECVNSSSLIFCSGLNEAFSCGLTWGSFKEIFNSALLYGSGKKIYRSVGCFGEIENLDSCIACENSSHLFGCIGLKNASYCIFNQQLSKSDFPEAMQKIKFLLKDQGASTSLLLSQYKIIPYNHSLAGILFPLNNVQAELLGYSWDSSQDRVVVPEPFDTENICEITGVPFIISPEEQEFLDSIGVTTPNRSPIQRFNDRLSKIRIGNSHNEICSLTNEEVVSWDKEGRVSLARF